MKKSDVIEIAGIASFALFSSWELWSQKVTGLPLVVNGLNLELPPVLFALAVLLSLGAGKCPTRPYLRYASVATHGILIVTILVFAVQLFR